MKTISAQYLEYPSRVATPAQVQQWLRDAFDILPLSIIALGWNLSLRLEDAVAYECAAHEAALYRWHSPGNPETGRNRPGCCQDMEVEGLMLSWDL